MPQPRSVQAAAQNHVDDWDQAARTIDHAIGRLLGGNPRGAARAMTAAVRDATRRLETRAAEWASNELAGVYRLGVQVAADVTGLTLGPELMEAEVAAIAAEHVDDVASVGAGLRRGVAGFVVPDGLPVLTPAQVRALSPAELADLLRHPIGLVRYADGSYRTVADHGDMLTRTRTALTYNRGSLDAAVSAGSTLVVIRDGAGCGLSAHNDGTEANGMVLPPEIAYQNLLAHPRCQRSFQAVPAGTSMRAARRIADEASTLPIDAPLPLPPIIRPRPRVQRARATRAVRARRALRRG